MVIIHKKDKTYQNWRERCLVLEIYGNESNLKELYNLLGSISQN